MLLGSEESHDAVAGSVLAASGQAGRAADGAVKALPSLQVHRITITAIQQDGWPLRRHLSRAL